MRAFLICVAMLLASAGVASASFVGSGITISVQAGQDSGSYGWTIPLGTQPTGNVSWSLNSVLPLGGDRTALEIKGQSGNVLATISDLGVDLGGDPFVDLQFAVTAGSSNVIITVTSALVSFTPITNPDAYATASVTLTDNNRDTDTKAIGQFDGGKLYQASYNGSTVWASLVDNVSAPFGSSRTRDERRPDPAQWETIPGTVSSIQTQYKFELTAHDQASGTSRFEITPEPATMSLLVVGFGLLLRRRRS